MAVTQKVIAFVIVATYISPCSGVLTLRRLDSRLRDLENDLHAEIKYREEDVQHLTSMIDTLEESVQDEKSKHGTSTELHANSHLANTTFVNILNKAFSDEKMLNSRTRRNVAEVKQSVSELTNMVSSCTDIQTQLNIIVETLKHQSEIISAMHKYIQPKSCQDISYRGLRVSGIYRIYHNSNSDSSPLDVYCDMETDGGGWTVFQRRQDGSEDFYRDWSDYEHGFGHLNGEFWLGNMYLSNLTRHCCHELRIDMEDYDGNRRYAKYSKFQVGSTDQKYVLTVDGYSGDAGDSLTYHNNSMFTTKDRDNDITTGNCASICKGGWWYKHCLNSNLNGLYFKEGKVKNITTIFWFHFLQLESLKYVDMKFR